MKRFCNAILLFGLIAFPVCVTAEEAPLGSGYFSVKLDYIQFSDSVLKNANFDSGPYLGFEGYFRVIQNVYAGAELGWAFTDGAQQINGFTLDNELTYIPVEANVKYAVRLHPSVAIDFGGGLSCNYTIDRASSVDASGFGWTEKDWVFGVQTFGGLSWASERFVVGFNAKYQWTDEFKNADYDFTNWRVGATFGLFF